MGMRLGVGALLRRLLKEEGGVVLILYALLIPVIIGIIGLAIDGGRVFIVNSELQNLADAAALAGAAELDGTEAGMTAATDRALNLLNNDPRWSNVVVEGSQIQQPTFCSSPLNRNVPWDPWKACNPTTDPKEADFIEIITIRRDVSPIFMVALGATSNVGSKAIAIAGTSTVACNVQPLRLCNPQEDPLDPTKEFSATPGQMFVFKQMGNGQGSNPLYAPGDFGLLDPPGQDSSTGPQLQNLLSQQSPNFCYVNQVSPRPGQAAGKVDTGINVRFDEQPGNTAGLDLTPAPDVIKGFKPKNKACGPLDDLGSIARLPRDTVFNPVGTTQIGTQGPSTTDLNAYWQYHHGSNWPVDATTGAPLTRYQAYQREIALMKDGTWGKSPAPENPVPVCAPSDLLNKGTAERRILDVVIVDCQSQGVQGNSVTNVRSNKYAEFFVTEPSSNGTIYTEFERFLTVDDDDSKLHKIVQLYR
jgi:hypothetical protein